MQRISDINEFVDNLIAYSKGPCSACPISARKGGQCAHFEGATVCQNTLEVFMEMGLVEDVPADLAV